MAPVSSLHPLLIHAKTIVEGISSNGKDSSGFEEAVQQLKSVTFAITSAGRQNKTLSAEEETAIWDLVCSLWNACVDISNQAPVVPEQVATASHAQLRQFASDLVGLASNETASDDERLCKFQFFHKTGKLWAQMGDHETAEACYARAMEYAHSLLSNTADATPDAQEYRATEVFSLYLDRTVVAWELQQQALASNLLARAKDVATSDALNSSSCFHMSLALAKFHTDHAIELLQSNKGNDQTNAKGLLNAAAEIVNSLGGEEEDPNMSAKEAAAKQMQAQVYRLLAWIHIEAEDNAECGLNCLVLMRKVDPKGSNVPAVSFLHLKALCCLGRPQEAETELLATVTHIETDLDICLKAVIVMLDATSPAKAGPGSTISGGMLPAIKSAVGLIQERFADQADVAVQLVRLLLAQEQVCQGAEEAALDLCAAEATMQLLTKEEARKEKTELFNLLHSHATNHFQQQAYGPASRFFSAAYMYTEEGNKSRTARVMSVCNIGLQDLSRALDYVDIAAKSDPSSVYNAFLRLRIHLSRHDSQAAADQVKVMLTCDDFTHEILRVSAQEALTAGQDIVAKAALQQLHGFLLKAPEGESFKPGDEAMILINLARIMLSICQDNTDPSKRSESKDSEEETSELATLCHRAATRAVDRGYQQFFGSNDTYQPASLEWFAATCWNAALHASQAKHWQPCAVFFAACGTFYQAHPSPDLKALEFQKMAFLMAACASLEVAQEDTETSRGSAGLAHRMVQKYKSTAAAIASMHASSGSLANSKADKSLYFMLIMEFDIAVLQDDEQEQHRVLTQCQETPGFSAENMLKLAETSQQAAKNHLDVTKTAYSAAQKLLLSMGHAVPYDKVALVLRTRLGLSSNEPDRLSLYKEARDLITASLPGTSYPDRELQWLVTTCWNKGAHQGKFMRLESAGQYMRLAMELLKHCHSLSNWQQIMEREIAQNDLKLGCSEQPEAPATDSPKDRKRKRIDDGRSAVSMPVTVLVDLGSTRESSESA